MYIYRHYSNKKKKEPIELLQELSDIDIKCQSIDENEMFRFLTGRIKCVEVSLNYILYKVYFPLLNKAKQIQDNNEMYFKVDNTQLSNFVNIILNSYDKINLTATVDYKINKLFDLPFLNIIFKNNNLYSILLLLTSITQNILIMLSYSTFTKECKEENYETPKLIMAEGNISIGVYPFNKSTITFPNVAPIAPYGPNNKPKTNNSPI